MTKLAFSHACTETAREVAVVHAATAAAATIVVIVIVIVVIPNTTKIPLV